MQDGHGACFNALMIPRNRLEHLEPGRVAGSELGCVWRGFPLSLLAFILACGGEGEATNALPECACGSTLGASDMAESFDEKLAEFSTIACGGTPAFRGDCSDGKSVLYIDGGFGHTALYYVAQQLVGSSRSSDIFRAGCPSSNFGGTLEDVTCEVVSAEPLCPSSAYPGGRQLPDPLTIPFADGQLSPWCEPQQ